MCHGESPVFELAKKQGLPIQLNIYNLEDAQNDKKIFSIRLGYYAGA